MTAAPWARWAEQQNAVIRSSGRWRAPRSFASDGISGELDGVAGPVVSFATNDYLGLSQHPAVVAAGAAALHQWGAGAGSARLIVGSRPVHHELEAELASWKRTEAALLFPTGFQANLAALAVLAGPDVTVCSDELNHASIIDGCRLARGAVSVWRHGDLDHLAAVLRAATAGGGRALVVADTVFSMDGDVAPLAELAELAAAFGALLVLDDAHDVFGASAALAAGPAELVRVGTLSKFLGSIGGFVAGPRPLVELLVNRARPFIFTTASPPADAAAALAALGVLRSAEGGALVERLRRSIDRLRPAHPSPIVPVVLGDEQAALDMAAKLLERGLHVPAIRPPTVPVGSSRLRVTLSAAHTDAHIDQLLAAFTDLGIEPGACA
jgi:8-amino-7-oxononanoate synthase